MSFLACFWYKFSDFAKLRAFHAYVPTCLTCRRAFEPLIITCLRALNHYIPSFFTWLGAYAFTCQYIFFAPMCHRAYVCSYFTYLCACNHLGTRNWHRCNWCEVWWKLMFWYIRCCKSRFVSVGPMNLKYLKEPIVLDNFLMGPKLLSLRMHQMKWQKPHKVILFWGAVCFGVLKMKGQIIQRKTAI